MNTWTHLALEWLERENTAQTFTGTLSDKTLWSESVSFCPAVSFCPHPPYLFVRPVKMMISAYVFLALFFFSENKIKIWNISHKCPFWEYLSYIYIYFSNGCLPFMRSFSSFNEISIAGTSKICGSPYKKSTLLPHCNKKKWRKIGVVRSFCEWLGMPYWGIGGIGNRAKFLKISYWSGDP